MNSENGGEPAFCINYDDLANRAKAGDTAPSWPRGRTARRDQDLPRWIEWPVWVIAVVVVVPARLAWEFLVAACRFCVRRVLRPLGRFLLRTVVRPLIRLLDRVTEAVARWLKWCGRMVGQVFVRYVWPAVRWLVGRQLLWPVLCRLWRLLWPVLCRLWSLTRWLVYHLGYLPLSWVTDHLIVCPCRWLAERCAPLGRLLWTTMDVVWRATGVGWRAAGRLLVRVGGWCVVGARVVHRFVVRPIGLAVGWVGRHTVVPVWRGAVRVLRATVIPVARWIRHAVIAPFGRWMRVSVVGPVAEAARAVLTRLGVRP